MTTPILDPDKTDTRPSLEACFRSVYHELRAQARQVAHRDQRPTAMVHEAYLKLCEKRPPNIRDLAHFRRLVRQVIQHTVVDRIRFEQRVRRGGNVQHHSLVESDAQDVSTAASRLELVDMLERLTALNPRHGMIAVLRLIGGLTNDEIAQELSLSRRLIVDEWTWIRAWLRLQFSEKTSD